MTDLTGKLREFYAVTQTSLYRVIATGGPNGQPVIEKLARHDVSRVDAGGQLAGSPRVGVSDQGLALCDDAAEDLLGIALLWGTHTSPIVGLFLDESAALACYRRGSSQSFDPRWLADTRRVLAAIGTHHPVFFVGRQAGETCNLPVRR